MSASINAKKIENLIDDGKRFIARGQLPSARNRFRDAALLAPSDPRAHFFLGSVFLMLGQPTSALRPLAIANELVPDDPDVAANYALALAGSGERQKALGVFQTALIARPNHTGLKVNIANVLIDERRYSDALAVLSDGTPSCDVFVARAQALIQLGRPVEALAAAEAALAEERGSPAVLVALRAALNANGKLRESLAICQDLISKGDPSRDSFVVAARNLVSLADRKGALKRLSDAIQAHGGINNAPIEILQEQSYRLIVDDPIDTSELATLHRAAARRLENAPVLGRCNNTKDPDRRLRIGFVSADFRNHSVMHFLVGPLSAFNHSQFDIHLYSAVVEPDAMTEQAKRLATKFVDIHALNTDQAAAVIQANEVDILIDLSGHTQGNRLDVFARQPAPVQAAWLGYPYSTGLKRIQWRITDNFADPPSTKREDYSEHFVRLEHFLCYRGRCEVAETKVRPHDSPIVFGSFNNLEKCDDRTIAYWTTILRLLPRSKLVMRQRALQHEQAREAWRKRFSDAGIEVERLDFGSFDSRIRNPELEIHSQVDICLDPLGYNGTTTTCNALWMGVPVVVVPGKSHAARVGVSIMAAANLPELIARDESDAVEKVLALAADRSRLAVLRAGLRTHVAASPLCDATGFVRSFESKMREIWREWCRGFSSLHMSRAKR